MEGDTLMSGANNQRILIYLDRESLQLYVQALPSIVTFPYPPTAIRHGEVINKDALFTSLQTFLTQNKVPLGKIAIVLSPNTYFEKAIQFPKPAPQNPQDPKAPTPKMTTEQKAKEARDMALFQEEETKKFLENIPFDSVTYKTYKLPDGFLLFAANRDFYEKIVSIFEKLGFMKETVIPLRAFGDIVKNWTQLSPENVRSLYTGIDNHKSENLLLEVPKVEVTPDEENTAITPPKESKTDKKRLIGMIIILIGLMLFTIYFYFQTFSAPPPKKTVKKAPAAIVTQSLSPTISEEIATTSAEFATLRQQTSIVIQHTTASSASAQARNLETTLSQKGYEAITRQTQQSVTARTTVFINDAVNESIKEEIVLEIEKLFPALSVQEISDQTQDVIITIGTI